MSQVNKPLGERIGAVTWQVFPGLFTAMVISFGIAMVILGFTSFDNLAFQVFAGVGVIVAIVSLLGMIVSIVENFLSK